MDSSWVLWLFEMNIFYFWRDWRGEKLAILTFRATRDDAQAWIISLNTSATHCLNWSDQYHLLECQDNPSVNIGLPDDSYFKRLVLNKKDDVNFIAVKEDDGTYTPLPQQLQVAFEMAFKLEQPLLDSRDADGNSWRDRPRLF